MPRSSRQKSSLTRSNIIEAAYRLFVEKGYNAASMREISQNAGVTVGAIYNHFETKEDIWTEVLQTKHPYHEIIPLVASAEGGTLAEVVRSAAQTLVRELYNRPDLFNLMFIEIVEFQAAHIPKLFQAIVPHIIPLQSLLKDKTGKLREIPIPILLRSFIGLFFSYYITGVLLRTLPEINSDDRALNQFVDVYLKGILDDDDPVRREPV
jgi:AcrR family transcriptional regulator